MREYVFRYANGYGCDMSELMDGGRVTVGEYFASDATDHYGTLHEQIVRCRDCKHRYEGFCMLTDGMGDFKRWLVDDDDYCSDGETGVAHERVHREMQRDCRHKRRNDAGSRIYRHKTGNRAVQGLRA